VSASHGARRLLASRFATLSIIALVSGTAAADGFVWEAPPLCPDADSVRQRIERRLGDDTSVHGIEVKITRDRSRNFVAQIDTRAITVANQVRTLTSARCDELADAVAVIVARLAIEARQRQRVAVVEDVLMTVAAPRPSSPLVASEVEQTMPAPRASWGGGLRVLALSGIGMVPRVGVGGELAGFVRRNAMFGEAAYMRWAEQPTFLVVGAPGRVDVGLHVLALRGGWASDRMPLRAWLGVELGSMTGAGVALHDPRVGAGRWIALSAGFGVAWPMSRHSRLVGTFELAVPVERAQFSLADGSEIYEPAPASARCALGFEVGWQ